MRIGLGLFSFFAAQVTIGRCQGSDTHPGSFVAIQRATNSGNGS